MSDGTLGSLGAKGCASSLISYVNALICFANNAFFLSAAINVRLALVSIVFVL